MEGYIKLWRKFEQWGWFSHGDMVKVFIWLLLRATHKKSEFMGFNIARGQAVIGIHMASSATGVTPQSFRTCIKRLKSTNEITTKSTNKFTIVTIVNYDSYQKQEIKNDQQTNNQTNKQLTNEQQTTNHIQECKEHKNKALGEVVSTFQASFREFYGGLDYFWEHGKDNKLMAGLLKTFSPEELNGLIVKFFASKDPFVLNGKHTIGVFKSQINKLRAESPKKVSVWDTVETI